MAERPTLEQKVNKALAAGDLHYKPGSLEIRHLLDVIINDVGPGLRAKAKSPGR